MSEHGDIRKDLVKMLALTQGGDEKKAEEKVAELEAMIRHEAAVGAQQVLAGVGEQTQTAVQPWVIAAIVLGALSVVASVGTLIYVRRTRR